MPFPVTDLSPLLFFNSVDFSPSSLFEKITNYVSVDRYIDRYIDRYLSVDITHSKQDPSIL